MQLDEYPKYRKRRVIMRRTNGRLVRITSSRAAVEAAIRRARADKTSTWDELASGQTRQQMPEIEHVDERDDEAERSAKSHTPN